MSFVRRLLLVCSQNNILFLARHVPGIKNDLADSLSRLQIHRFQCLAPAHLQLAPGTYPDSSSTRTLVDMVKHLLRFSPQPSSLPTYRRAWRLYSTFSVEVFGQSVCTLPLPPSNLAIFITYL